MIEVKNLVKTYITGDVSQEVLKGIDFKVEEGDFVSITGKSGSGKSTFIYQLSLLDEPTEGEVIVNRQHAHKMSEKEKTAFRLGNYGFVFQDYAILPDLTAAENVMLPVLMRGKSKHEARKKAEKILERFELGAHVDKLPNQMSGGEQQRVSIARAIVDKPSVLFADEPTANLDSQTSETIMGIFEELNKEGQTIVMITHELEYARLAKRLIEIHDGLVAKDEKLRR